MFISPVQSPGCFSIHVLVIVVFVDSYGDHGMDLVKAVGSCEAEHPIVLLAHRPAAAKLALDSTYNIQLVLSGTGNHQFTAWQITTNF